MKTMNPQKTTYSMKYKKPIKKLLFIVAAITFHFLFTNFLYK